MKVAGVDTQIPRNNADRYGGSERIRYLKGNIAMDGANAYALLGVDRSASPEAVTRAFRAAAKRCHPDHGGDRHEFEALWAAYEWVRSQPVRRHNPFALPTIPVATFDAYDARRRPPRRLTFAEELAHAMAA